MESPRWLGVSSPRGSFTPGAWADGLVDTKACSRLALAPPPQPPKRIAPTRALLRPRPQIRSGVLCFRPLPSAVTDLSPFSGGLSNRLCGRVVLLTDRYVTGGAFSVSNRAVMGIVLMLLGRRALSCPRAGEMPMDVAGFGTCKLDVRLVDRGPLRRLA